MKLPWRPSSLLGELKRRRVIRATVVYAIIGWIVIQVAVTTFPALTLPDWTVTFVIVLVILGLPVSAALAWAYDLTPEGIKRADEVGEAGRPAPSPASAGTDAGAEPALDDLGRVEGSPADVAAADVAPAPRAGVPAAGRRADPDGPTRLIVLPFQMLRPDPDTDFLAFSLPDAITSSLSGIGSLVVRSQLAALPFAGEKPDLESIAGRANVDVVLSGTLVRVAERLRVSAQLTDVRDGTLLWSRLCQVELGDLFELQEQLTRQILDSLRLPLTERDRRSLRQDVSANARAYEFYLRANQVAYQAKEWSTARDLYRESVRSDPDYAPAWARLARCYRLLGKYSADPATVEANLSLALEAFERALSLNPELSLTHNLYAQLEVDLGRARDAMVRLLTEARKSGGDAQLYAGLVHACRFVGLLDSSLAAHHRARALDPEVPTSVAHTFWMLGRYEDALGETFGDIGYMPGLALASLGREEEALAHLRVEEQALPDSPLRQYVGSLRALLEGRREETLAALDGALANLRDGEARYYLARTFARVGASDRALEELERVVESGFVCHPILARDPWLDPLGRDARFRALSERAESAHLAAAAAFTAAGGEAILDPAIATSYTAPT